MTAALELPQSTFARRAHDELSTHSRTPESSQNGSMAAVGERRPGLARTASGVHSDERGDEKLRDYGCLREKQGDAEKPVSPVEDEATAVRERSEVAREVVYRIDELVPLIGEVAFVTPLQSLKRSLSRAHDVLAGRPSENVFLSVVTLMESALAQRKWKEYTKDQLLLLPTAADLTYRKTRISFDDYERLLRDFAEQFTTVGPRIDLDAFEIVDLADDEEET